jgi:hypothetical protein
VSIPLKDEQLAPPLQSERRGLARNGKPWVIARPEALPHKRAITQGLPSRAFVEARLQSFFFPFATFFSSFMTDATSVSLTEL